MWDTEFDTAILFLLLQGIPFPLSVFLIPIIREKRQEGFDKVKSLRGRDGGCGGKGGGTFSRKVPPPLPSLPSPTPLPAYGEILRLAQTELAANKTLLIGKRGRGGSRQHGAAARALERRERGNGRNGGKIGFQRLRVLASQRGGPADKPTAQAPVG